MRVLDGRDMVAEPVPKAGALLGRGEGLGVELVAPEPVDERFRSFEQGFHPLAALAPDEVVGVLPCG